MAVTLTTTSLVRGAMTGCLLYGSAGAFVNIQANGPLDAKYISRQILIGTITGIAIAVIGSIAGTGAAIGAAICLSTATLPYWQERIPLNSETAIQIIAATLFGASAGYALSLVPWM